MGVSFQKIRWFTWVGIIKSLYINFKLLPFTDALRLPIIVTKATTIGSLSGQMKIECPVQTGMIRVGFFNTDFYSWRGNRTYFSIKGEFIVRGNIQLGVGVSFIVDEGAIIELNNSTCIGAMTKIICRDSIRAGENFRVAWESQIMDTNFHYVLDINKNKIKRKTKGIVFGKNNWIGNRSSVMPGTITPDFFIVASNSICNQDYTKKMQKYSLVGGIPIRLLKEGFMRIMDEDEYLIDSLFKKTIRDEISYQTNHID